MVCNLEGPITKAALLRGMENLALDMYHEPGLASSYIDYATRLGMEYLQFIDGEAELDCCFVAAASDNPDIFGQEAFLKYSVPNLALIREASRALGLPTIFHPHGDLASEGNRPLIEKIIGTGAEGFQFAEGNDHCALKRRCADRIALLGGIDAFSTLLLGPPERIELETRAFLNDFQPWNGYVFMCSCSLHRGMPMRNVEHMVRTVRGFPKKGI
jgi:uroporphyrinogen decarboxylase